MKIFFVFQKVNVSENTSLLTGYSGALTTELTSNSPSSASGKPLLPLAGEVGATDIRMIDEQIKQEICDTNDGDVTIDVCVSPCKVPSLPSSSSGKIPDLLHNDVSPTTPDLLRNDVSASTLDLLRNDVSASKVCN